MCDCRVCNSIFLENAKQYYSIEIIKKITNSEFFSIAQALHGDSDSGDSDLHQQIM